MISASLSPNTDRDDVILALKTIVSPSLWRAGDGIRRVRTWFENEYARKFILTSSGRVGLFAILKSFGIGEDDEVITQAFTCVAVPNSIRWTGARPVYVDIDETFNIDPSDVKKKITKRTKAIVVQHTFGIPAAFNEIDKIAKKHSLIVIEDCAHSLGAMYQGKKIGTLGDAAFFSFGRDKVISSVWGGAATIDPKYKVQNEKLNKFEDQLPEPNKFWIFQQLLHPIAFSLILLLYDVYIGRALLVVLQKLRLLSFPVFFEEKHGGKPSQLFVKFPNALAVLAANQLKKVRSMNDQRQKVAALYAKALSEPHCETAAYLRFSLLVENPGSMRRDAKKNGILLGNWYHNVIDPAGVDITGVGYERGSCPKAENAARHIINLPTRISLSSARYVVSQIHH